MPGAGTVEEIDGKKQGNPITHNNSVVIGFWKPCRLRLLPKKQAAA
jgi:hypothetical protein